MKYLYNLLGYLFFTAGLFAQNSNKLNYQNVIRYANNELVANQSISLKIDILKNPLDSSAVYSEIQFLKTNSKGLISTQIGIGESHYNFSKINWSEGPYYIISKIDPNGGSDYSLVYSSKTLSVPYAFHSHSTDTITGEINSSLIHDLNTDSQKLSRNGDTIFISNGNYIVLPGLRYIGHINQKNIQDRLNNGETPFDIYKSNHSLLDSLYGKKYQGGLIAYLNTENGSGILSAPYDQSTSMQWGCTGIHLENTNKDSIGTGFKNTDNIILGCQIENIAAKICSNFSINGYSDWFLPSKEELNQLFLNLKSKNHGEFSDYVYYSSTQYDSDNSWGQYFKSGLQNFGNKSFPFYVRAIRYF